MWRNLRARFVKPGSVSPFAAGSRMLRMRRGKFRRARLLLGLILGLSGLAMIMISLPGGPVRATTDRFVAQRTSAPGDGVLKLVVAVFRHGVRSPTPGFAPNEADKHSKHKWPALTDWQVMGTDCDRGNGWGYLTTHGQKLAEGLGAYYGKHYKQGAWSNGFSTYLWADAENQRTRATANALAAGFKNAGIPAAKVTVASLPACTVDPLFHPFQRKCGTPNGDKLKKFAAEINEAWLMWAMTTYDFDFRQLYDLLNCFNKDQCSMPLIWVTDNADACVVASSDCNSPLLWKGRFSYASSASEAFLLEYANNMNVGWGRVDPPNGAAASKLRDMLKLHEFYFDKTDRFLRDNKEADQYLAGIEGSNLIREILDQIKRKVGQTPDGKCPRATPQNDFVGLIGHDTNLASVGALLELQWQFDDKDLPSDTFGLPANDALPAGALVFELRQRSDGTYFVRVEYVTQSLEQMRNKSDLDKVFRLAVDGPACLQKHPCEIPLKTFQQFVEARMGREFLSRCNSAIPPQQTCGVASSGRRKK